MDAPLLPRRNRLLLDVGQHVSSPIHLEGGDQIAAQARDSSDHISRSFHHIERARINAPVLVNHEVSVGSLHERIVLGCLDTPVLGVERLPRGQWLIDGIGGVDDPPRVAPKPRTGIEEVCAHGGEDALVEVRAATVVTNVIKTDVERGNPEHLGAGQFGLGYPDPGLRSGHDQRAGVGEPECRGKADREPDVGPFEWRGFEFHIRRERR